MEKVSLEDLAKEKVYSVQGTVKCNSGEECNWEGNYIRCYLDTFVNCPHYVIPPSNLTPEELEANKRIEDGRNRNH